ncbi:hypothetical protein FQA39_LY11963 [Lamprigera yunnana]|nr:hypothetical protein FQA39_LY11963 [Lamprigera yunnana]
MKAFLIISLFIVYVYGATNLDEDNVPQAGSKTDLRDDNVDVTYTIKPPQTLLRENVLENKRRRCENCRKLRRCKVHNMCDLCNNVCRDILDPQEQNVGTPLFGEVQNDNTITSTEAIMPDQSSNSGRYYGVGNIGPGPNNNLLSRILNNPTKKDVGNLVVLEHDTNATQKPTTYTANVFKKSQDEDELKTANNNDSESKTQLSTNAENDVGTIVGDKRRLLSKAKVTKDELNKIIARAKSLHNRRSNREGLLHLRTRNILNRDNANDSSLETQRLQETIKDKSPLGTKLFQNRFKSKFSSVGFRRKLDDDENQEMFTEKLLQTTTIEPLPIFTFLSSSEKIPTVALQPQNTYPYEDELLQLGETKKITTKNAENDVLNHDKFVSILRNLEKKVETIADLVRKTCGQVLSTETRSSFSSKENEDRDNGDEVITELPTLTGLENEDVKNVEDTEERVSANVSDNPSASTNSEFLSNGERMELPIPAESLDNFPILESKSNSNDDKKKTSLEESGTYYATEVSTNENLLSSNHMKQENESPTADEDPSTDDNGLNEERLKSTNGYLFKNRQGPLIPKPVEEVDMGPLFGKASSDSKPDKILLQPDSRRIDVHHKHEYVEKPSPTTTESDDSGNNTTTISTTTGITVTDEVVATTGQLNLLQRFSENDENNKEESSNLSQGSSIINDKPLNTLGEIIPQGNLSHNKVIFISNGMQLPLNINKQHDGTYQISMDVEKLCQSCSHGECHTQNSKKDTFDVSNNNPGSKSLNLHKREVPNLHKKRKLTLPKKKNTNQSKKRTRRSDLKSDIYHSPKFLTKLSAGNFDNKNDNVASSTFHDSNSKEKQSIGIMKERFDLVSDDLS